jgi:aspartyl-tRNA(Asn)/glutamyl-tRNA(Gln) amidotransferase subunit B
LEEDVGKLTHFDRTSGVDFNRAGVPLLEIVSEPDITGADMAHAYLNALTEILHQGGISDCDMEKGMVRCDVNISVRPVGTKELGAKIEIKNMNSFSGVRRAAEYEIARQIEVLKTGGKLVQSTRRWDDVAGIPLFSRTRHDAARADGRVARRCEGASHRVAACAQAAVHARLRFAGRTGRIF